MAYLHTVTLSPSVTRSDPRHPGAVDGSSAGELAPTGLLVVDGSGKILSCDAAVGPVSEPGDPAAVIGAYLQEVFSGDIVASWPEVRSRVLLGRAREHFETTVTNQIGESRPVFLTVSPLRSADGVTAISIFVEASRPHDAERNVSRAELECLNGELRVANRALEQSNVELERFAYVASHDLQEPLRMITSYLQLLQKRYQGNLDATADEFIGFAVDGAKRMKQLINDLLALSRMIRTPLDPKLEDLRAIVAGVLDDMQVVLTKEHATVHCGQLPTAFVDKVQIRRVFQNLIANAIKYRGDEPAVIHITGDESSGDCHVIVADNGIGIGEEHESRVFEAFTRIATAEARGGAGLGLAIVKNVVAKHGGHVWIERPSSKGVAIHLTIPGSTESTSS